MDDITMDKVRFGLERQFLQALAQTGLFDSDAAPARDLPSADRVRRRLLTTHIRLSENMAPEVFAHCRRAVEALALQSPVEIYQAAGEENAANWTCREVCFISLQGNMMSLLDGETFTALFGHEMGHHIAHTGEETAGAQNSALLFAAGVAADERLDPRVRVLASRLAMAKEFTADRCAALATRSLDGPLRLMMTIVTGLPSERLKADADCYLAQARAIFDSADRGTSAIGSHPEHLLRAYALSLFAESDVFRELTGSGPGTRTLAEVDALLGDILTGAGEHLFETGHDEPLPPEIQEFTLCAASILASADDHLDESEIKALEATFAEVISDWKELLDPERALERYQELLPLAVRGGERVAVGVFAVLVHVMLSDAEIHHRELAVLAGIGKSLRQEHLFNHLLGAVARRLRLERAEEELVERPMPALPPGAHETAAALQGLLRGLARRGGGSVTVTRLLRILGQPKWNDDILKLLTQTAAACHLELAAPPQADDRGEVRGDQPLLLRLTVAEARRREEAEIKAQAGALAEAKTRDALHSALKLLRERLVSGDGRSPSVRLYRTHRDRHFDLTQLDKVISGRSERVIALLHESTSIPLLGSEEADLHKPAQQTASALRNLEREFKARAEETGSLDFFAGYPFLLGNVGGFFIRAPLILHPFSLVSQGKGVGSFFLKRRGTDSAIANQALLRLLFAKKGYPFTEELAATLDERAAEGPEALLDALRDTGLDTAPLTGTLLPFDDMNPAAAQLLPEGIRVVEQAVIGFFPQSSSDLLQDYDELLACLEPGSGASLEDALSAACEVLPPSHRPDFQAPAHFNGADQPVVYSDPSQRAAVLKARASRLMVLDGPPGTGKSQTIVNLVADTLAHGGRVAIVCEKRVALDVVKQRMDSAGIGHLAALVHDVYDDRKALYTHIADRLEKAERRQYDDARLHQLRAEAAEIESQLAVRAGLLARPTSAGLSVGQLHAMAASFASAALTAAGLERLDAGTLPRLLEQVRALHPLARLFHTDSPFRAPAGHARRPSTAASTQSDHARVLDLIRRAQGTAVAYETAYQPRPIPAAELEAAAPALQAASTLDPAKLDADFAALLHAASGQPHLATEIEDDLAALNQHRAVLEATPERVEIDTTKELTAMLSIAAAECGSLFRIFKSSWRRAAAFLRAELIRSWPEHAGAKLDAALIVQLQRRAQAAEGWQAASRVLGHLGRASALPRTSAALLEQFQPVVAAWEKARQLASHRAALRAAGLWPLDDDGQPDPADWTAWHQGVNQALALLEVQRLHITALGEVGGVFPHAVTFTSPEITRLAETYVREAAALASADRALDQLAQWLDDPHTVIEQLTDLHGGEPAGVWSDALARGWAELHLAAVEAADPALAVLDQPPPLGGAERASARLLEIHQAIATEEALRLAAAGDQTGLMAVNPAEARARRTPEQSTRETLIRECRKQRNVTPMRALVRRHATQGLLDVVPVWLMSPETTAILFPRQPVFDLLVIDEASQCTVESGFPVLTRARRAVVAGDDKQMPPTSFFKASSTLEADETAEGEDDEVPADTFESESLLVLARGSGAGAPLRWHYRALFEELIAFSNHSMYGGSLLTIPATLSRSAPPAVRYIRLEDGQWDKGANLPEARRVVDVLHEVLSRPAPPSVGIVTFNLQQRRAIMDEIDARRAADTAFAAVYDAAASKEALDERPFVKNLESVQGDERDTIVFSLGYAPVPRKRKDGVEDTYVPARFGPLGQKGGERRLNVAVSRAKKEVIVVSSFDPAMLSVAHTKNDGPRLFKAFVEFARHLGEGRRAQAEKILSLVNDTAASQRRASSASHAPGEALYLPLHHQLSLALEAAGLRVETLVGTSEFRLPVAIVHDDDHHRYALAILCEDGAREPDIYEDYVHIPNVLAHRQWRHLRLTAREWHRAPQQTLDRIRLALGA